MFRLSSRENILFPLLLAHVHNSVHFSSWQGEYMVTSAEIQLVLVLICKFNGLSLITIAKSSVLLFRSFHAFSSSMSLRTPKSALPRYHQFGLSHWMAQGYCLYACNINAQAGGYDILRQHTRAPHVSSPHWLLGLGLHQSFSSDRSTGLYNQSIKLQDIKINKVL